MSPMAKMPGTLVWNFAVSTLIAFLSSSKPHSAIGPSFGCRPKNASTWSASMSLIVPSVHLTVTPVRRPSALRTPVAMPST